MSHELSNMQPTTSYPPVTNQPNFIIAKSSPDFPIHVAKREFTHGLCDCCGDFGECCCAYLFPCVYECQLFTRANEGCCSCLYGGLVPLRTKVRTERGIAGSICGDFCVIVWCPFCALVQLGRELKDTEPLIKAQ